ncbi:MAG: hypothetical protein EA412_02150 [Chitinophagaceae bacterium]|nr:MAG: hypothetical protein EA412_02150 [Chitinophagaceae bacterium]
MLTKNIKIQAFRAIHDNKKCEQFYNGHINVLKSYGIDPISSAQNAWFYNPEVYAIIAFENDTCIGGVKLHKTGGTQALPLEDSIGFMDERIYDIVDKYSKSGAAEACGLWNSRDFSGLGLSNIMMIAVVATAHQLNIKTLFGITSDHTEPLFRSFGYRVIRSIGSNGNFSYPTPKYLSRVIKMNSKTLSSANPYNRRNILSLRQNPKQKMIISNSKVKINVEFDITLSMATSSI